MSPGPRPQIGRAAVVEIIDTNGNVYPLQVEPGSYQVQEAQRFGDKISVGPLQYQDFNPFESASVSAQFHSGYGLRRYSDWPASKAQAHDAYGFIKEAVNVDCSHDIAILSPQIVSEALPSATAAVVWMGEVVVSGATKYVAVCGFMGQCIYWRNSDGTWSQQAGTTSAAPVVGAVGVFNGKLVLGYGTAATAQYTGDGGATLGNVVDDAGAPASLYVHAFTADRSASYIAGGAVGDPQKGQAQVMSSSGGVIYQRASIVAAGSTDDPITALAPGGGLVTLYVGKVTHLGSIDNNNVYRVLIPYELRLPRNSQGLRWWMGRGEQEQRGPQMLVVPRDRQTWLYEPSNQTGGNAQNITPWADPDIRPPTVRGETRAVLGTARWLYSVITNGAGHTWVLRRDARSGVTTIYLDLGVVTSLALGITALFGTNPLLFIGQGNGIGTVTLPLDSEWPPDDAACRYQLTGTLDLPDIDLGFISEPKVEFSVQVVGDNFSRAHRVLVQYALDSGAYTTLGTAQESPVVEILFPDPRPVAHWLSLRLTLTTTDATQTPQLRAVVARQSINPKLYRLWVFQARIPAGTGPFPSDTLLNAHTLIEALWALRISGVPVIFSDRWHDRFQVRIINIGVQEVLREPERVPEALMAIQLLEITGAVTTGVSQTFALGDWTNYWFPMGFPGNGLGPSTITGAATVVSAGTATAYPTFVFTGPGKMPVVSMVPTPLGGGPSGATQTWTLDYDIPAGATVTANFDPVHQAVVDQDGTDLSAHVAAGSVYWGLPAGYSCAIGVVMGRATTASQVVFTRFV